MTNGAGLGLTYLDRNQNHGWEFVGPDYVTA
jgi:hypothetical protein